MVKHPPRAADAGQDRVCTERASVQHRLVLRRMTPPHGTSCSMVALTKTRRCCAADSVQELLKSGKIRAADVQGGNCMHPACLKSSLTQSLAAMHIGTVRVCNAISSLILVDCHGVSSCPCFRFQCIAVHDGSLMCRWTSYTCTTLRSLTCQTTIRRNSCKRSKTRSNRWRSSGAHPSHPSASLHKASPVLYSYVRPAKMHAAAAYPVLSFAIAAQERGPNTCLWHGDMGQPEAASGRSAARSPAGSG